MNFITYRQLKL